MGLIPVPPSAVNRMFITAEMLMPPWTDPMAVMDFQKFLIGMGLKCGEVMNEDDIKNLTKSLEENGMQIKEGMSTFEGLTSAAGQVGGELGRRVEDMGENMDNYIVGRAAKSTGNLIGKAGTMMADTAEAIGVNTATKKINELITTGGEEGVQLKKLETAGKAAEEAGNNITKLSEEHASSLDFVKENSKSIADIEHNLEKNSSDLSSEEIAGLKKKKQTLEKINEKETYKQEGMKRQIDKEHGKLEKARSKMGDVDVDNLKSKIDKKNPAKDNPVNNEWLNKRLDKAEVMKESNEEAITELQTHTRSQLESNTVDNNSEIAKQTAPEEVEGRAKKAAAEKAAAEEDEKAAEAYNKALSEQQTAETEHAELEKKSDELNKTKEDLTKQGKLLDNDIQIHARKKQDLLAKSLKLQSQPRFGNSLNTSELLQHQANIAAHDAKEIKLNEAETKLQEQKDQISKKLSDNDALVSKHQSEVDASKTKLTETEDTVDSTKAAATKAAAAAATAAKEAAENTEQQRFAEAKSKAKRVAEEDESELLKHDKAILDAKKALDKNTDNPLLKTNYRNAIKAKEIAVNKIKREQNRRDVRDQDNTLTASARKNIDKPFQDAEAKHLSIKEKILKEGKKLLEDTMEKDVSNSSGDQAADKTLNNALILYENEGIPKEHKIAVLTYAIDFSKSKRSLSPLLSRAKIALNKLTQLKQRGGSKFSIDVDDILEKVLVKTNKEIEEHVKEHDKVDHPNFPEYSLVLTSEELDKTGMFYTHCYEEDKLCKDKVKQHFEDVLKSFEDKEKRQQEEKVRPKHLLHEKRLAQIQIVFESLSTKQEQKEMHDIMIELFMALKEHKSKEVIISLLNKGIRKGSIMGVKLLHTYQALHNIDIKKHLKPTDEKDYLDTMMGIIFCPMCPFIELAKMLDMKEDINNEYYTLMHNNKTLVLTIVNNYYNPGNIGSRSKERQMEIARETKRRFKVLMRRFEKDPITKQIHDGVVDSMYDEFKVTNSNLCDPWKFLTQDIDIDIDILLLHCKKSHKFGLLAKQQKDIALPFKHGIDIFDAVMSHTKEDKGIWCGYLHSIKQFIETEKTQQKVIFMKVIDGYTSKTSSTALSKSLKATTTEENAAIELEKHTLHFLKQLTTLLKFDNISDSIEYDYSVLILERLMNYMGNNISSIFEKLLKLGTIEGKHEDGVYHSKLTTTKEYINGYLVEILILSKNIKFRFSLYKKLHPIRDNEDDLRKLVGVSPNEDYKQKGGSSSIENQLKQQLEDAQTKLHDLEQEENNLRQMRGGLRKSRQFTRKQRGGNLSSSLKQYAHKTTENQTHQKSSDNTSTEKTNTISKEGGKLDKNTVEHFSKIQQLESELNTNKFETYKQMEKTYQQLVHLKNKELKQASKSCLHTQLMDKVKTLSCEKDCLRQLQTAPTNNKITCGCKRMPEPFNYKNC